jgi:hypothetical protein
MPEVAAPVTNGAAPAAPVTIHDRLKARLSHSDQSTASADEGGSGQQASSAQVLAARDDSKAPSGGVAPAVKKPVSETPAPNEQVEGDDAPDTVTDPDESETPDGTDDDDAQFDPAKLSSLTELADAAGLESDRLMDLQLPVKIDGKEGTARLRDLVKSYQLDGHINQKLATFDNDRKSFETKKVEYERAANERLLKLDAGAKTLERALMGEFAAVDWQKLQTEDPVRFNSEYVAYQQRYAVMQDIANQIKQEQQKYSEEQQAKAKEFFEENFRLLQAKVPEWSDKGKRDKDKAEIVEVLKDYGLTREEFESIVDHRQLLVVRDAVAWRKLQKSKPALLNKVKAAPKLLKPGSMQSRAAKDAVADQADRTKLRQTGKVRDAVPAIKRRLFGGR